MPSLFNIRNYSTEVINIQRREAELNIILQKRENKDNYPLNFKRP